MSGIPSWAVRGAKVICIETSSAWSNVDTGDPAVGPTFGDIFTIKYVVMFERRFGFEFMEWPGTVLMSESFRPLTDDTIERDLYRAKSLDVRSPKPVEALGGPLATSALLSRHASRAPTDSAEDGQACSLIQTTRLPA